MSPEEEERFWAKVSIPPDVITGCWLWTAARSDGGYGIFGRGAWATVRTTIAHRLSYEVVKGPIPLGLQLDHLCRVRHCVNPAHLEAVTGATNVQRGLLPAMGRKRHADGKMFTHRWSGERRRKR